MKKIIINTIQFYQYLSGGVFGGVRSTKCIFIPSCSEYTIGSVEKYGALRGAGMGLYRFLRCNPFQKKFKIDLVK